MKKMLATVLALALLLTAGSAFAAQKVGVACVPGSSFFDEDVNHIVRLHFAKKDETLFAALDRLSNLRRIMCG